MIEALNYGPTNIEKYNSHTSEPASNKERKGASHQDCWITFTLVQKTLIAGMTGFPTTASREREVKSYAMESYLTMSYLNDLSHRLLSRGLVLLNL